MGAAIAICGVFVYSIVDGGHFHLLWDLWEKSDFSATLTDGSASPFPQVDDLLQPKAQEEQKKTTEKKKTKKAQ